MSTEYAVKIENGILKPYDDIQADELKSLPDGAYIVTFKQPRSMRTWLQNRALHLYFKMLGNDLNDAGLDMRRVLKPEIDIPWKTESVKEYLWKPVQSAVLDKESTTQLETSEVDEVYKVISRHMAQKFGITTLFPTRHTHD